MDSLPEYSGKEIGKYAKQEMNDHQCCCSVFYGSKNAGENKGDGRKDKVSHVKISKPVYSVLSKKFRLKENFENVAG